MSPPTEGPPERGSLRRSPPPPPPPSVPIIGGAPPRREDHSPPPPLPPGLSNGPTGLEVLARRADSKWGRRSFRILLFFVSPLGIIAATWGIFAGGSDSSGNGETASTPVVQVEATSTTSRSVATSTTQLVSTTASPVRSTSTAAAAPGADVSHLPESVVFIGAFDCDQAGSGTIVGDGYHVLTNAHVVESQPGSRCEVGVWFTNYDTEEVYSFDQFGYCVSRCNPDALGEIVAIDSDLDLAVLELRHPRTGARLDAERVGHKAIPLNTEMLALGERIFILGYPGSGGLTITHTSGSYSGLDTRWDHEYYKTDATVNHGNSGGAAFTEDGRFIGVPTAGTFGELECDQSGECSTGDLPYGLIRPSRYAVSLLLQAMNQ